MPKFKVYMKACIEDEIEVEAEDAEEAEYLAEKEFSFKVLSDDYIEYPWDEIGAYEIEEVEG